MRGMQRMDDVLMHHGTKNQEKGKRKYQELDGTWTPLGLERRRIQDRIKREERARVTQEAYEMYNAQTQAKYLADKNKSIQRALEKNKMSDESLNDPNASESDKQDYINKRKKVIEDASSSFDKEREQNFKRTEFDELIKKNKDIQSYVNNKMDEFNAKFKAQDEYEEGMRKYENKRIQDNLNRINYTKTALSSGSELTRNINNTIDAIGDIPAKKIKYVDLSMYTTKELNDKVDRINAEKRYLQATTPYIKTGKDYAKSFIAAAGSVLTLAATGASIAGTIYMIKNKK